MCVIIFVMNAIRRGVTYDSKSVLFGMLLLQAFIQSAYCILCLAQYYCLVDFLRSYPILVYIRLLYFHNPDYCGTRVNIGSIVEELPDPAFVLVPERPFSVYRTFIMTWINLGFCLLWFFASMYILATASKPTAVRWPWVWCTIILCCLDFVSAMMFAHDLFYTMTLKDLVEFIGGTLSGSGNVVVTTAAAATIMTLIHMRFVAFFALNVIFVIVVLIDADHKYERRQRESALEMVEQPTQTSMLELSGISEETEASQLDVPRLPRVDGSRYNARTRTLPAIEDSNTTSFNTEATVRPPADVDNRRTVRFPKNLLSLPQRIENMIAAQETRLDRTVYDSARRQTTQESQSIPQPSTEQDIDIATIDLPSTSRGRRRSTVAELQSQLPWTYIEASSNRMRDQLPPDEDLPPVPLPDYAAMPNYRKSSVHRAASSLSALNKKRYSRRQSPLTQSDVLY